MRGTPLGFEKDEEHLQQLLEKGIIEPSSSEWASPPRRQTEILHIFQKTK
jgi:hypothetical protein